MKVSVKYFGQIAEAIELNNEYIELPNGASYNQFLEVLNSFHPSLQGYVYKVAVNKKIVNGNVLLEPDSEIAILPPYSGG